MRHATAKALDDLEPVLAGLRAVEWLTEKRRGIFYRRSQPFLHFHEDPAGLFADLRSKSGVRRLRVTTAAEQEMLLRAVKRAAPRR